MNKYIYIPFLIILNLSCLCAQESVVIAINKEKVLNRIDQKIYGQFLEHIYHSVSNGIWGETVWNRSFEDWNAYGDWKFHSNGHLNVNALQSNADYSLGNGKNYALSIEVKRVAGAGTVLLGVRDQRRGRVNTNHLHSLFDAGKSSYHKFETSVGWVWYAPVSTIKEVARVPGTISLNSWTKLRIHCKNNHFTAWVNEQQIFDRNLDKVPLSGSIILGVEGIEAEFRNLTITSLDESPVKRNESPIRQWNFVGDGSITAVTTGVVNHDKAVHIYSDGVAGIAQEQNYDVKVIDLLKGSVFLKGSVSEVNIQLLNGTKMLSEKTLSISSKWKEYPVELPVSADCTKATLRRNQISRQLVHRSAEFNASVFRSKWWF